MQDRIAVFLGNAPVFEVHRAIHVRTGPPSSADALDQWLAGHGVEIVALDNAYDACVHLLKHYDQVADLALVGTTWLGEQEFRILHYIRETWPRVGVVIYGSANTTPAVEWVPLTMTCPGEAAVRELVTQTPTSLLHRLTDEARVAFGQSARPIGERREPAALLQRRACVPQPGSMPTRPTPPSKLVKRPAEQRPGARPGAGASTRLTVAEPDPPRAILSAEELSALLGAPDEG